MDLNQQARPLWLGSLDVQGGIGLANRNDLRGCGPVWYFGPRNAIPEAD